MGAGEEAVRWTWIGARGLGRARLVDCPKREGDNRGAAQRLSGGDMSLKTASRTKIEAFGNRYRVTARSRSSWAK